VRRHKLDAAQPGRYCGLPCTVCWGAGSVEPTSLKFQNRFVPILASVFVGLAFLTIFLFGFFSTHLDKILPFAGTLIGSITGYYFAERGDAKRQTDARPVRRVAHGGPPAHDPAA
jgi:hypothetical protein